ncbi:MULTISPECIES: LysR family transcriptional regulator [Hyphomicrobiales]|uniref:LysR family transcriptional regulator n=2 Tax=Prosthecodimorpha TaxID=2981530 RepID=A0A0P6WB28_9HYPH|nr:MULTISPECIES: LysR family transcriptional regulator [Hyphomicrobiales]KPL51773.1 LysR family transcriptional regulator [Prosthecomicrobium hirschii]MBT9290641.1 LysR family transcriptional regulator [Prosthecodimorpha staleyi]MCW1843924.1 LysR family transcriptional regulator [Prosthecomicrobium hirschii]TPQ51692.1 LysR family transcriptional regulator [Prosthecomicrobium hirschii]
MDWDKLRIFHAAAEAGSFTHAGEKLDMSQSAVSRQVSALEQDLNVPLFHRHARGLILTEQGELLFRTAREVLVKLDQVRSRLVETKEKPSGSLRVTTTFGLGTSWLTARIHEFVDLYPDVQLELILDDEELDLGMRQADVALRIRQPVQPDLIQRKLFTVHFHLYASQAYLKRHGSPESVADLDEHRTVTFGQSTPTYLRDMNWLETAGRQPGNPRKATLKINNVIAIKRAVERGIGIALLPDYLIDPGSELVQLIPEADVPAFDCYFVYPEEMRNTARVKVFRDFLITKAERWTF